MPNQTQITVLGLTPGNEYKFSVVAYNFNGAGAQSAVYSMYACVNPSVMVAPYRITSNETTITVGWVPPTNNGGCPITGYAVFMDNGTGTGNFSEVNTPNDPAVRGIPGLN